MRLKTLSLLVVLTVGLLACGPTYVRTTLWRAHTMEPARFNQLALRLDLPLFWTNDANGDGAPDPSEVRGLLFYPSSSTEWVHDGEFTGAFDDAATRIAAEDDAAAPTDPRRALVVSELDQASVALIDTDLSDLPAVHRDFVRRMIVIAGLIDRLYARQRGMDVTRPSLDARDSASVSLFRRNWGPQCLSADARHDPTCSAIEGAPFQPLDVYPASLRTPRTRSVRTSRRARTRRVSSDRRQSCARLTRVSSRFRTTRPTAI